jgi:hypothetical protein
MTKGVKLVCGGVQDNFSSIVSVNFKINFSSRTYHLVHDSNLFKGQMIVTCPKSELQA